MRWIAGSVRRNDSNVRRNHSNVRGKNSNALPLAFRRVLETFLRALER
jgi:hypothetical protein